MASLKDFVAFLISEYPRPVDLTKGRLEKLVYLCDCEWAWRHGEQVSEISWRYNDFGPFTGACTPPAEELEAEEKITIKPGFTGKGNPKQWYEWISGEGPTDSLSEEEKEMAKKIIDATWRMPWGKFVEYVYSTSPMVGAEQYDYLDIVGTMKKKRHEILDKVTKDNLVKYQEDFEELAKL